jgi:AcrR family transcriptional regulator
MKGEDGKGRRPYRMRARAKAKAATGDRILDAAEAVLFQPPHEMTLAAIAARAGVTVQTVLRHFGDRDGVSMAAVNRLSERVGAQRATPPPGDIEAAAREIVEHYETVGDGVMMVLAEEQRNLDMRPFVDLGRAHHRDWCRHAFGPALEGLRGVERERRLAQLIAVTDVYMWKLLRRDRGLSRRQTELAIRELVWPLFDAPR